MYNPKKTILKGLKACGLGLLSFFLSAFITGLKTAHPQDPFVASLWSAGLGGLILGGLESVRNWIKHKDS